MKIILFADLHMCPRASIVNKWGTKYPSRLENCITSMNWLERKAKELQCDYVISLGDFFDKPDLTSETITASNDIEWSNIPHYSIVGNHDASNSSLTFNSVNSLLSANHKIISEPTNIDIGNCELCFLPYIVECDRKPIEDYFGKQTKHRVILSHNDIMGIQMGPVVSKTGFGIEEIEATCDYFINGHLHNGQVITSKIINLGNLTGKDFGEDAFKHSHCAMLLDTNTLSIEYLENPYAYNFYKLCINTEEDLSVLSRLKNNAVISVKCEHTLVELLKQRISELSDKIVDSRIILVRNVEAAADESVELDLSVDHLARFIECCKSNIEYSVILEEELSEICK
jgi:DNA repair exonuclease SbcCD nuclease subunit